MKIKILDTDDAENLMVEDYIPRDISKQLRGKIRTVRRKTGNHYKVIVKVGLWNW